MNDALGALKARLTEINDVNSAAAVLGWDQSTYMPPGGAAARGRQRATLRRIAHEWFTGQELGDLLAEAQRAVQDMPPDSDDAALVRRVRIDRDRSVRIPVRLVSEISANAAASFAAWKDARPRSDFAAVRPYLERTLELSREYASHFPEFSHPMDALIDDSDEGMTVAIVQELFGRLRANMVPLAARIASAGDVDTAVLRGEFDEQEQLAFGRELAAAVGYDFQRGRCDLTPHPFMTKFSLGDVRITTRVDRNNLGDCMFSMLHEAGHALYEQGIDSSFDGLPIAGGASSGIHESQSRLWENVVGRSTAFWSHYYPALVTHFPEQLSRFRVDEFVRAINRVRPSLIRTEADEVTYNLHVMIRFDLEVALIEGRLSVADLPEAWRARYQEDLGVSAPNDTDGVLQDVHWYGGLVGGAFQGYTLGNVMSAQFYEAAVRAHPNIPSDTAHGRFDDLRGWLTENVYRHGAKFLPAELLQRATGESLRIEPYLGYLRAKYGTLYGIDLGASGTASQGAGNGTAVVDAAADARD